MKLKFLLSIALVTFSVFESSAQVNFSNRPSSLQVYPRGVNDSSNVIISGEVVTSGFTKAIFTFHKSGNLIDSSVVNLNYNGNIAPFAISYAILAGKVHHRFKMFLYNGITATQILRSDSVCSGDIYLINGQSNGNAIANGPGTEVPYLWVRSFGTQNNVGATCLADTAWGLGNGTTGNNRLSIGVWALRLGKMLADTSGIPVCIINGSRSGTRIILHLPSADHLDMESYYGRLLYRAQKAGVSNNIKGLFWYQGESDTDTAYLQYANRFAILYNAWKQDFQNLSKIIVMQTRPGCLITQATLYHQQTREILRSLPITYPDVNLMTTVGIPDFDGCHFYTVGYLQLAAQLYNKFCDDFIGKSFVPESDPPNLLSATYSNNNNTEISLVFDQAVQWPALFNGYDLKDYIYLNSTTTILSGSAVANTVKLQLSASTNASKISYLPGIYYAGTNTEYAGPWLLNNKNVGVPSFYQYAITNDLIISANGSTIICGTDSVILSTVRAGQTYQWYRNNMLITNATSQSFVAKLDGSYYLIVKDANNLTDTSNVIAISYGSPAQPTITSSNGSTIICSGSSTTLTSSVAASWLWSTGATTSSILVDTAGSYSVTTTSINGCTSVSNAFVITVESPAQPTITSSNGSTIICSGSSTTLTSSVAASWLWSTGATTSSILVDTAGSYSVTTTSINGCTSVSNAFVITVESPAQPTITSSNGSTIICSGSSTTLTSSVAASWLWSTGATTSSILVDTAGSYSVTTTSINGCTSVSNAFVITVESPAQPTITSSNGSTIICSGSSTTLTSSVAASWLWSTGATTSSILVDTAGSYSVTTTSINGCTSVSNAFVITVESPVQPTITSSNGSTIICSGSSTTLTSSVAASWLWSTGATTSSILVDTAGSYSVTTTSINGCTSVSNAFVITVESPAQPTITSSNGSTIICSGSSTTLTSSVAASWLWSTGATTSSILVDTAGSYSVATTSINGCTSVSNAFVITVESPAQPTITSSNGSTIICSGSSTTLTSSVAASWLWSTGATTSSILVDTAGSYSVTTTSINGCTSVSNAFVITVESPVQPTITSSNGSTIICSGSSTTLTSSVAASWLWSTGATTSSILVDTAGSYSVTTTSINGCTSVSNAFVITVESPAQPTITSSNGSTIICSGSSTTLTSSVAASWLWSTGATTSSILVDTAGSYSVTTTSINGCTSVSNAFVITVESPAQPTITLDKPHLCIGDSILLSVVGNFSSILWSNGSTLSSFYIQDSSSYFVTVTNSNGCSSTSSNVQFPIHELPEALINFTSNRACPGQTIPLSSSLSGLTYSWSTGQSTSSINVSVSGEYTLTVTDQFGCVAEAEPVQITIAAPVVSINPSGSKTICSGSKQVFTAVFNSSSSLFQWYRNNVLIAGAINATYQASMAGTYTVRYTDTYGCTAVSSGTILAISSSPTSSFVLTNHLDECKDTIVTCTANSGAGLTYQWQKNSIQILGANSQVFTTSGKGTYGVITTNSIGCSKSSSTKAIPVVNPAPPVITASGPLTFCNTDSVVLTSSSGAGYLYQWFRGSSSINNATSQQYVAKITGAYKVRITIPLGCTANSSNASVKANACASRIMTDGSESSIENILIYPQPFKTDFNIQIANETKDEHYFLQLYSAEGSLVFEMNQLNFYAGLATINPGNIPDGVYFYRLFNNGNLYNGKIVKD